MVEKTDGCWLWRGHKIKRYGYGQLGVKVSGRWTMVRAHRVSYMLHFGPIPDGMVVMHRCDHTACVNPAHLHIGTQAENMHDMRRKGRGSAPPLHTGTRHYLAKFTPASLERARALHSRGESIEQISRELGVDTRCVRRALRGETYTQ